MGDIMYRILWIECGEYLYWMKRGGYLYSSEEVVKSGLEHFEIAEGPLDLMTEYLTTFRGGIIYIKNQEIQISTNSLLFEIVEVLNV